MLSFLKLIRLPNLLIIAFTQYIIRLCLMQPILALTHLKLQMNEWEFAMLVLATVMIAAGGYSINDYFDIRIDRINKPEQLVIDNGVKRRTAMSTHAVLSFTGIAIGIFLAWKSNILLTGSALFIFSVIGLWFYSTAFKYQLVVGNMVIAILAGMVPFLVALFEVPRLIANYSQQLLAQQTLIEQHQINGSIPTTSILIWTGAYGLAAFVISLIREIIKDTEDAEGDIKYGCRTIPIVLGIKKTKIILYTIILFFIAGIGYVQHNQYISGDKYSFFYFILFIQLPLAVLLFKIFKAREKKHFHSASMLTKVIMLFGIGFLLLLKFILLK